MRSVCQTVRKVTNEILGVKGLKDRSLCPYVLMYPLRGGGGGRGFGGFWLCSDNIYLISPPLRLCHIHMNMNPPASLALIW